MTFRAFALAALLLVPAQLLAQAIPVEAGSFVAAEARAAATTLADRIERIYVYPEIGRRYAATLRAHLAAGRYDSFPTRAAFAETLTADLQAISPDGHLKVRAARPLGADGRPHDRPPPIPRSGWLAPGVAYVAFNAFTGSDEEVAQVKAFMVAHADAETLIIDAREHHGGGIAEMNVMFSYLYPTRAKLVVMDQRVVPGGDAIEVGSGMEQVPAPEGLNRQVHYTLPGPKTALATAKVFLLTSKTTASAGEHLSLALKRTHRATLIGETTAGAGHFGEGIDLGNGYRTFIGIGRTYDPETGKDWEGTGVQPDIAVPADQALDVALKEAGVKTTAAAALAALR